MENTGPLPIKYDGSHLKIRIKIASKIQGDAYLEQHPVYLRLRDLRNLIEGGSMISIDYAKTCLGTP